MANLHRIMIRERWPDKALFANVLLLVAGALGLVHAFAVGIDGIAFNSRWLAFVETYPWWATAALSLTCLGCAVMSLITRSLLWGVTGAVAGFFSFGLILVEPALSLAALVFLFLARREREYSDPRQTRLTARHWPDKSLAASALLFMAGTATMHWWAGILVGVVHADGLLALPWWAGVAGILVAALCFMGSYVVYHQQYPYVGMAAAVGGIAGVGLLVVAPLMSLAALILIALGIRENEFGPLPDDALTSSGADVSGAARESMK